MSVALPWAFDVGLRKYTSILIVQSLKGSNLKNRELFVVFISSRFKVRV